MPIVGVAFFLYVKIYFSDKFLVLAIAYIKCLSYLCLKLTKKYNYD